MSASEASSTMTATVRRAQGPSTSNRGRKRTGNSHNSQQRRRTNGSNGVGNSDWKPVDRNIKQEEDQDLEDNSGDTCVICAEKIKILALTPCNHSTCHKCCLRQRALYKKKQCLVCRSELDDVIFTDKLDETYDNLNKKIKFEHKDEKLGIRFTSKKVMDESMKVLKFTCPFGDTDEDFGSYKKLNEHLKKVHNRTICMICAEHKRAFPSELEVMTFKQLKVHETRGDPKEGFKGHPVCPFCPGLRFYSEDELNKHMKLHHERCHICDQIDPNNPQWFRDYDDLFEHFKKEHYVCTVPSCLEKKFVVFRDELDLRAHIIKEHPHLAGEYKRSKTLLDNNPKKFRSEITTFSNPGRGVTVENGHTGLSNSMEMKRKRMEQRARHYVENSEPDFQAFLIINDLFNKNEFSAQDLKTRYEELFSKHKDDVHLLIFDLSELYNASSEKHKQLRSIYDSIMKRKENQAKFKPLVSDSSNAVNVVRGKWGQKGAASVGGSSVKFTSLPPVSEPVFSSRASYTNLQRNNSPKATPVVKTGLSSNSSSSTSLNYAKNKPVPTTSIVNSQPNVTAIKSSTPTNFPKLQVPKQKKFVAPPIKQMTIPDPSSWGRSTASAFGSSDSIDMNGLDNALPSTGRKRGKQKQLLFHIGV